MYRVADLFAGVGGLSLGFEELGFSLAFANDNDVWAGRTFQLNHPDVTFSDRDITSLDEKVIHREIGQIDVLVGGVPCQAFSMAGVRNRASHRDRIDERVFLFRHFIRFAAEFLPKIIVIENVKGLPSMYGGAVLAEIQSTLATLGYASGWQILNAADYGAPQLRERFVLVATRDGYGVAFPSPHVAPEDYRPVSVALEDPPSLNHSPRALTGKTLERVKLIAPGENWRSLPEELRTRSRHSGAYGRLHPDLPSRTLLTRFDSPPVGYVTHPFLDRTLTVREGARIQGFPDDFEFLGPVSSQYRQVGNAVSPYMSRAIAVSVMSLLERDDV